MISLLSRVAVITHEVIAANSANRRRMMIQQRKSSRKLNLAWFSSTHRDSGFCCVIIEKLFLIDRKEKRRQCWGEFSASFPSLKTQSENHFPAFSFSVLHPRSSNRQSKRGENIKTRLVSASGFFRRATFSGSRFLEEFFNFFSTRSWGSMRRSHTFHVL